MSYSLATLRSFTRRYINEEDADNSHFTDAELNDYLNQAVIFLGDEMEWPVQVDEAPAIAEQTLYQLPSDFIALVDVYFDSKKLILLDRADLGNVSATWQDDPSGIPTIAYQFNRDTLGLYRTPDSGQDAKTIQIQYIHTPAELSEDADIPDLHAAYQICLPFYAAFCCETKLGNDKAATGHMAKYDQHRNRLKSKVQKYSDDLLRFRWAWPYS